MYVPCLSTRHEIAPNTAMIFFCCL